MGRGEIKEIKKNREKEACQGPPNAMGRGEKERKTTKKYDFLRNLMKNREKRWSGPVRRLQKAPKGLPGQATGTGKDLPRPAKGGSDGSERGKTFQKLWKTMIFLRIWWKMKKNYDFLGSGPIRRLQKGSEGLQTRQRSRRLKGPGQPRRLRLLRTAQNDEKPMKMMIFWSAKCPPPIALEEKPSKNYDIWWNPRILRSPDLQIPSKSLILVVKKWHLDYGSSF